MEDIIYTKEKIRAGNRIVRWGRTLILFRLVDIEVFVMDIIGTFAIGNSITVNFLPFLLPTTLYHAIIFTLILVSVFAINAIIKKRCPKIFKALAEAIEEIMGRKQFNQFF